MARTPLGDFLSTPTRGDETTTRRFFFSWVSSGWPGPADRIFDHFEAVWEALGGKGRVPALRGCCGSLPHWGEQVDAVSNEEPSKAVLRAVEAVQEHLHTVVDSMM